MTILFEPKPEHICALPVADDHAEGTIVLCDDCEMHYVNKYHPPVHLDLFITEGWHEWFPISERKAKRLQEGKSTWWLM